MTAPAWIALAGALVTLGVNLAGSLVAWGVLQATVQALAGRIGTLEQEVSAFGEMKLALARMSERQDMLILQVRDLNAAIRWMRDPADPGDPNGGHRSPNRR